MLERAVMLAGVSDVVRLDVEPSQMLIYADEGLVEQVAATSPYYDGIEWAVDEGITNGTTAPTFSPSQNCTRAQIITYLWRAAGSTSAKTAPPFPPKSPTISSRPSSRPNPTGRGSD